jgi:hypothetical protein
MHRALAGSHMPETSSALSMLGLIDESFNASHFVMTAR